MRLRQGAAWIKQQPGPGGGAQDQHGIAHPRDLSRIVGHGSVTLTIDADPPDGDVCPLRQRAVGNDPDVERIHVERMVEVQGVDDLGDLQYEVEALPGVPPILLAGPAQAEETDAARRELGMIARLRVLRQVDIGGEHRTVLRTADVLEIEVDAIRPRGFERRRISRLAARRSTGRRVWR
jgi:hypothetical protein